MFCSQCGAPEDAGTHAGCLRRQDFEPPRWCPDCGRRMKVQVTPRGWTATCVQHGARGSTS